MTDRPRPAPTNHRCPAPLQISGAYATPLACTRRAARGVFDGAARVGSVDPRPLSAAVCRQLGRGARRAAARRDRQGPQQAFLRLDLHARHRQARLDAATRQERDRHRRPPGRPGRCHPSGRSGHLPVQGFSSLHGGATLQRGDHSPPARRGLPPARHLQDHRRRRPDAAVAAGAGQRCHGPGVRPARTRRVQSPARPHH